MDQHKDQTPNIKRLAEMENLDEILRIFHNDSMSSSVRDNAARYLVNFIDDTSGPDIIATLEEAHLCTDDPLLKEGIEDGLKCCNHFAGHREDVDFLLITINDHKADMLYRGCAYELLLKFKDSPRKKEIARAFATLKQAEDEMTLPTFDLLNPEAARRVRQNRAKNN